MREVGQQVLSLILGPDETGVSEAFASFFEYLYLTIGKKIRSNTHYPTYMPNFMNNPVSIVLRKSLRKSVPFPCGYGNINNCGDTVYEIEKRRFDKDKGGTKVFTERTFRYYRGYA